VKSFHKLINDKGVFTTMEIARKTNLMHTLNIMAALLGGFSNRNERAIELLTDYAYNFPDREAMIVLLERTADLVIRLGYRGKAYWLNKANMFSLVVAIANHLKDGAELDPHRLREQLDEFERQLPADYRLAATEAVNSTRARQLRDRYLSALVQQIVR
jgi:hypothetical protein